MKNSILIAAISLWIYVLINPLGVILTPIVWIIVCFAIAVSWSNKYAILSFVCASSYYYSNWEHYILLFSRVLPIIFMLTALFLFIALLLHLLPSRPMGRRSSMGHSSDASFSSSDAGSCDSGGGCDGGGGD